MRGFRLAAYWRSTVNNRISDLADAAKWASQDTLEAFQRAGHSVAGSLRKMAEIVPETQLPAVFSLDVSFNSDWTRNDSAGIYKISPQTFSRRRVQTAACLMAMFADLCDSLRARFEADESLLVFAENLAFDETEKRLMFI